MNSKGFSESKNTGMPSPSGNRVVHLELCTPNLPRACSFYTRLFDWQAETVHIGAGSYLALEFGTGLEGGVTEQDRAEAIWLPYVEVGDVQVAADRARSLGGSVSMQPREGPAGWRSVVTGPAAGAVALWQPKG
jgi:predicted enzyme related to lactoylglutathione lyase